MDLFIDSIFFRDTNLKFIPSMSIRTSPDGDLTKVYYFSHLGFIASVLGLAAALNQPVVTEFRNCVFYLFL